MASGDGGKIIPPSKRPDGTLRKEIRVRAGYVPPDEVQRYESKGTQFKKGVGVPGLEFVDDGLSKPKGKSAARNERRKQKKEESASSTSAPAESLETRVAGLSVAEAGPTGGKGEGGASAAPAPSAGASNAEDERGALEKKLRALKKKIRQAEAIEESLKAGGAATDEQKEKVSKLPLWRNEENMLEKQISQTAS
ncbi:Pym super family protein [Klebsormidium nitens]|uniref:Pym super family protein n=1 Tax=Klebsormidium nitens TaxID=105231 RepID=A0A1Y1HLK7_KLENI|nr:Pym super family protein [Klebsormidium nitens]|eukprot:GAQ78542.1 Pym super family protein [Klebsormidium nitens]